MNIFVLDRDPKKAAEFQCDKHIVKMCLETAQILSSALALNGKKTTFKQTHVNHPCCVWARNSQENYEWLYEHFLALLQEYTERYGKQHACFKLAKELSPANFCCDKKEMTEFAMEMPDQYKTKNAVESYRNYYLKEKVAFAKWRLGNEPIWWI